MSTSDINPSLSAIVVIPDKLETVETTMDYLRKQTRAELIELVFVGPDSSKKDIEKADLTPFHSWKFVQMEEIPSIGSGFTAGIFQASAPIIALTEDHSYPDQVWAESFIKAHQSPWAVVGPSMRNGNPINAVSWADYYQAYGQWNDIQKSGKINTLPGHNSSYKRELLLAFGDELKVLMQAESILHRRLKQKGYEMAIEAETRTAHLNFFSWSSWIPARYYAGRQFAGTWAYSWSWIRKFAYAIASPGIPWLRLWRTHKYVWKNHKFFHSVKILFIILLGFIVEAYGNFTGFLAGIGDASCKIALYEFHRLKAN
jgi:hypothetical protein